MSDKQSKSSDDATITRRTLLGTTAVGGAAFLAGCSGILGEEADQGSEENTATEQPTETNTATEQPTETNTATEQPTETNTATEQPTKTNTATEQPLNDRPSGQIYPVDTDASDGVCQSASGKERSATGSDSAEWFEFGGCGSWKQYSVVPNETYWVLVRTDAGLLRDGSHEIQEQVDSSWETKQSASGPTGSHKVEVRKYSPDSDQFRIVNVGPGCYVEVYGPKVQSDQGNEAQTEREQQTDDRSSGQIHPIETDASDGVCESASGETKSATGPGSAEWFEFGGCGTWKQYSVVPSETYWILTRTDDAMLTDASYEIQERVDASWETKRSISGPKGENDHRFTKYVPDSAQFRIVNVGAGCYVEVYGDKAESSM